MKPKLIPFLALIWEAGRYALLMDLLHLNLNPLQTPEYSFFFFWLGSYAFLMLLGLGLIFFQPEKYVVLAPVIGVGKLLQALAGLLFVLYEFGVIPVVLGLLNRGVQGLVPAALLRGAVPAAALMVVLDLSVGIFLVLYRGKNPPSPDSNIPVDVTEVEDR